MRGPVASRSGRRGLAPARGPGRGLVAAAAAGGGTPSTAAYDAFSSLGGAVGLGNLSWTHTPVGTPRGVVVFVNQFFEATDFVTAVTYGGVTMTEVAASPALGTDNAVYAYFLGASVPAGAQTVAVTAATSVGNKRATCITFTAGADMSVDISGKQTATAANPSITLATVASNTVVVGAVTVELGSPVSITETAAYTMIHEHDFGASSMSVVRRTTNPTGGNVVVDWTAVSSKFAALAVAVT